MSDPTSGTDSTAQDEVAELLVDLIRINTSNPTHPERPAAEWVAGKLDEVGLRAADHRVRAGSGLCGQPRRRQRSGPSAAAHPRPPRRRSGRSARSGRVDPFAGEVQGRLRLGSRRGRHEGHGRDDARGRPRLGDAPAASRRATSCWPSSPTRRPAASRARTTSSTTTRICSPTAARRSARSAATASRVGDLRLYPIQTAEKGIAWLRLTARARPGHGVDAARRQRRHPARRRGRRGSATTSSRS